ncbi:unnamed protein product [Nezara viridula]|uniref:PHD-type domain-containing protein n=1 Tax=Nezara viridula TaxID=85310 RepID=A0A9P0E8P7_NEZVI|nr:unnamed protein product [Nezara viridula]
MVLCPICKQTIAREEKKTMACTVPTCQAIFHGKCLNADESEFEALRALRKNWECPKCEKARKNIQPTDKCLSPPRSAPQQQTVDSTSQLLLAAIKNLTEEVKGLKFSLDANANEVMVLISFRLLQCLQYKRRGEQKFNRSAHEDLWRQTNWLDKFKLIGYGGIY